MPPGQFILYSNHGYTLLGEIAEEISGMPFARFVDATVFEPLGMTRSSFAPPVDDPDVATGYVRRGRGFQAVPAPRLRIVPARPMRYSRSSAEKLALLRGPVVPVVARPDGTVHIGGISFSEIDTDLPRQVGGYEYAAFRRDARGATTHLFIGQECYERVAWYEHPGFQQLLLVGFLGVFVSSLFVRPERRAVLSLNGSPTSSIAPAIEHGGRLARIVGTLDIVFLAGLVGATISTGPGARDPPAPRARRDGGRELSRVSRALEPARFSSLIRSCVSIGERVLFVSHRSKFR